MIAERFASLGVALGVGFLIGLQREQSVAHKDVESRWSLGGVRTFPLAALLGAVAVLLSARFGAWPVAAGAFAMTVAVGFSLADDLRRKGERGATSEVAFLLTYFLGCLSTAEGVAGSFQERLLLCGSLGVVTTALLSYKDPLHQFAARVSRDDLYAAVKFGILAVVILPLLPNKAYGPHGGLINPFVIGLVVVLIAGVGFCGYVAVRLLGPGRGLGVTGLLGGLVSSTAITLSFSGRAKREPKVAAACALGVVMASTVMGGRMLVMVALINPKLLAPVAIPLGLLTAAGLAAGAFLYFRSRRDAPKSEEVSLGNPFEISSALKLGLIFTVVSVLSKLATSTWGQGGSYLAALVAGTTDVDAVTLSLSGMVPAVLSPRQAAVAISIAAASNTLAKGGIAMVAGGWAFGRRVALAFLVMLLAGGAGVAWLLSRP